MVPSRRSGGRQNPNYHWIPRLVAAPWSLSRIAVVSPSNHRAVTPCSPSLCCVMLAPDLPVRRARPRPPGAAIVAQGRGWRGPKRRPWKGRERSARITLPHQCSSRHHATLCGEGETRGEGEGNGLRDGRHDMLFCERVPSERIWWQGEEQRRRERAVACFGKERRHGRDEVIT